VPPLPPLPSRRRRARSRKKVFHERIIVELLDGVLVELWERPGRRGWSGCRRKPQSRVQLV
jgi:hypothetical protein